MTAVLYLALSNNIRGIAECFADIKSLSGFVKPSGIDAYVRLVKQSMDRSPADILFMAEAIPILTPETRATIPSKFPSVTKQLRESGFTLPIICASNRMAGPAHIEFLEAGGNVLLPLSRRNETKPFTVLPQLLKAQIKQFVGWRSLTQPLLDTSHPVISLPLSSFYGLVADAEDNVTFFGTKIDLSVQKRKLLALLVRAEGGTVSKAEMGETLYGAGKSAPDQNLRNYISDIRDGIKNTMAAMGLDFGLPLIEAQIMEGWRLNVGHLQKLAAIVAPETLQSTPHALQSDLSTKTFRCSIVNFAFPDFSHDISKNKICFRGLPLAISATRVKAIAAIFRKEGALISGNQLYEECYPEGAKMGRNSLYQLVARASDSLSEEIRKLGFEVEQPFMTTVSKSGWAANREMLLRLQDRKPSIPLFDPVSPLQTIDYP